MTTPLAQHACINCGAGLSYAPGTTSLECPYCGTRQQVVTVDRSIDEHDFEAWLAKPRGHVGDVVMSCSNCGAQVEADAVAKRCPFCTSPLALAEVPDQITPEAVVPFRMGRNEVEATFQAWVASRWFAPNSLRRVNAVETFTGVYLPHWTFDADTGSHYTGLRGEHYYVPVTYTTMENGRSVTRTRMEQRTRWYPASGYVSRHFDDVLVAAAHDPELEPVGDVGPWDLSGAVPYQTEYLSGYQARRYTVEPQDGLVVAKELMAPVIHGDVRSDIGGDVQQVSTVDTEYRDVLFKLVLLPLWIASYIHSGQSYHVLVNATTGTIAGERPYSRVKIFFAVLLGLVLAALFGFGMYFYRNPGAWPF